MTNDEREKILVLKEATRGLNPTQNITVCVGDLNFLTAAVLELGTFEAAESKAPIDGGQVKEAE